MPPPPSQRADIEPPEEITTEAAKGFMTGVFRFGSVSILAHMIMILPHPFTFTSPTTPATTAGGPSRPRPSMFSRESIRSRLFYRPLEGFSEWVSPASRVYRGLTPQFKVFLQIAAMTLGGCIWAERRVNEYIELMRRIKRAERLQAQREQGGRP
ncbi:hypothetical protein POX_c04662 [Penicillium oxalicum]|uniref:Uncharacterized protein n=1 Tax=Penicillium oxalicum (strain 114-2 / CGMCC 5302) TaxID=933388 RepID=S8AWA8_PENO1|nr:hypothetical protein POX_c04662 [Penicillium oxalicum]EPS26162.1 hypothetical protein PDE_01098 [Penicillium oxalicum 114-2]KAI2791783.1 hypothetical protein POX_c04662 [Penicillium oxalicum]